MTLVQTAAVQRDIASILLPGESVAKGLQRLGAHNKRPAGSHPFPPPPLVFWLRSGAAMTSASNAAYMHGSGPCDSTTATLNSPQTIAALTPRSNTQHSDAWPTACYGLNLPITAT